MFPWAAATVLVAFRASACASTDEFLSTAARRAPEASREVPLLDQLEGLLGPEHRRRTESLLGVLAGALAPTVTSLPKTSQGALSAASARYALHRLFVQRHGWALKGAAPDGGSWLPSSTVLGVGKYLPPRVRELFETHLGSDGDYTAREVALLAAVIEVLVQAESLGQLNATYAMLGRDPLGNLNKEEAEEVIERYLQISLLGLDVSRLSNETAVEAARDFSYIFPYWEQVWQLVPEAQRQVAQDLTSYRLMDVARILQHLHERLGPRLEETNCQEIKGHLLQAEERSGSGRVRLFDFYRSSVHGAAWQFQESIDYLRQMGVLDESDPSAPRVIMANYMYMHADCLQMSNFYDLCCISPCEGLLSRLERSVQAPHATPEEIVGILSASPSDAAPATNRTLAPALLRRLEDVAASHGGVVPLHGRLFAQWLHFAYPHECPYPHLAATTRLLSNAEWRAETGLESGWSESEMASYLASSPPGAAAAAPEAAGGGVPGAAPGGCDGEGDPEEASCPLAAMWLHEEEHVDAAAWGATRLDGQGPGLQAAPPRVVGAYLLRACMLAAVLLSFLLTMRNHLVQHGPSLAGKAGAAAAKAGIIAV